MSNESHRHNMQGIALVLLGALVLSVMDGVIKTVLESGFSVVQILAVRSWFIAPVMVIWAWWALPAGALRTTRPGLHFVRVALGFFAPLMFFKALQMMALADATVIFFGTTFLMTALSVPLLKERVGPHRWAAVIAGFIGVVIAAKPGGDFFQGGAVYALLASLAYAVFMLITRWMGRTDTGEGAFKQVLYFHAWVGIASSALVGTDFEPMTLPDVGWIAAAGALAVVGHLCLTRAFSIAAVGLVAPFEYSAMVWAGLIGYAVWGHIPSTSTVVGAWVIIASGLYLLHRETRIKPGTAEVLRAPDL